MDLKERIQELCKQKNVSMNKVETDKCYRILRTKRGQNKDIMVEKHPKRTKKDIYFSILCVLFAICKMARNPLKSRFPAISHP